MNICTWSLMNQSCLEFYYFSTNFLLKVPALMFYFYIVNCVQFPKCYIRETCYYYSYSSSLDLISRREVMRIDTGQANLLEATLKASFASFKFEAVTYASNIT